MSVGNTFLGSEKSHAILSSARRVALLGAGGIGMYAVGCLLISAGKEVVGSDLTKGALTEDLIRRGAVITAGDMPENVESCDAFVYTAAASPDNPVFRLCVRLGIPCLSRADALAGLLFRRHPSVAVTGMHGKSTVTAMIGHILARAGKDPLTVCGAVMKEESSPIREGQGAAVWEACEYMRSFLSFTPDTGVILNLDLDHTDCYPTMKDVEGAFASFASGCSSLVIPADRRVRDALSFPDDDAITTFGSSPEADCRPANLHFLAGKRAFTLLWRGEPVGEIVLRLPGSFEVQNAIAAAAYALSCGISPDVVCKSLSEEQGISRRMEYRGICRGAAVFDDYAHHPAEVLAALSAAREQTPGRLIAVFQSHTYSRTAAHLTEFGEVLALADLVMIAPIYSARESDTLGMSAKTLAHAVGRRARAFDSLTAVAQAVLAELSPGDTLLVMGAGDVSSILDGLPLILA